MIRKLLIAFLILFIVTLSQESGGPIAIVEQVFSTNERSLAQREISLNKRYSNPVTNQVFKDNILLTLSYMSGRVHNSSEIDWNDVREASRYELVLQPDEVFAFHNDVLPEYKNKILVTTHANFGAAQGFRSSGYLYGDGVCHLASLIHWAAKDAGLKVDSRVNHDFANIPEIPREFGTSIVTTGTSSYTAQMQNLYVENTMDQPVKIVFEYVDDILSVAVYK